MNLKLKRLVLSFIQHEDIVASWGITNIVINENMMSFSVNGFKFQGRIHIKTQKTMFEVNIGAKKKTNIGNTNEVITLLDNAIEKGDNYCCDICKWLEIRDL